MKLNISMKGSYTKVDGNYCYRDNLVECRREGSIVQYDDHEVIIAADITGVDKIYYYIDGHRITISNRFKDFLGHEINRDLLEFQTQKGFVPYPFTLLADVMKCPPGLITRIRITKEELLSCEYLPSKKLKHFAVSASFQKKSFRNRFQRMLLNNGKGYSCIVSSFSGGFDSVLLTRLYSGQCTYLLHFHEDNKIDIDHYRKVFPDCKWITVENTEPFSKEDVRKYFLSVDEPCCDSAGFAEYLLIRKLSELDASNALVVMNGQLADGIFANGRVFFQEFCSSHIPRQVRRLNSLTGTSSRLGKKIRNYTSDTKSRFERFCYGNYTFPCAVQMELDRVYYVYQNSIRNDSTNLLATCIALLRYSIYGIEKIRTAAHAFGTKYYVPFMSADVIQYAISIPSRHKIGYHKGKQILIKAFPELAGIKFLTRDFRPQQLKDRLVKSGVTEEEYKNFFIREWMEYNLPKRRIPS
jgi:asparagine synthetase B (glutamine-hydrolysing)